MSIIALTTDYGTRDTYVAALKGVILSIAPQATIVDVTHDIEPQGIQHGAFALWQALPWFPAGTIHVVVVDPGVGTTRRILAAKCHEQIILAPDNGLLSFVLDEWSSDEVYAVTNERFMLERRSSTFHGRDICAPVAAHLVNDFPPAELGPEVHNWDRLPIALRATRESHGLRGAVVHVDRFGNLVTNIRRKQLAEGKWNSEKVVVRVNGNPVGSLRSTYADVLPGEPVALFGSSDLLEVAVHGGSAADRFGPRQHLRVEVGAE